jgi:hypothetical protein
MWLFTRIANYLAIPLAKLPPEQLAPRYSDWRVLGSEKRKYLKGLLVESVYAEDEGCKYYYR